MLQLLKSGILMCSCLVFRISEVASSIHMHNCTENIGIYLICRFRCMYVKSEPVVGCLIRLHEFMKSDPDMYFEVHDHVIRSKPNIWRLGNVKIEGGCKNQLISPPDTYRYFALRPVLTLTIFIKRIKGTEVLEVVQSDECQCPSPVAFSQAGTSSQSTSIH